MNNYFNKPNLLLISFFFILNSCSDTGEDTDPCLNGPELKIDNVIASVEGKSTGEIAISANGGTTPYMYSIDGTNFQNDNIFSSLPANDYSVIIKDANGCADTKMVSVAEVPEVFYANQIRPIIDAKCQISPCHGSNNNIPSWATYNDVKAKAELIQLRTSGKSMPPSSPLPDNEIKLIADWVDQGAPNN